MAFHNLTNTAQFSYTGRDWLKNGGRYTKAPRGSRDYFQFWEEEDRRCRYGYRSGDLWIPGRMYFWLNFFPISRIPQAVMMKTLAAGRDKKGGVSIRTAEKVMEFPSFWEIHYEWWNYKHIAWYGGEFMGVKSPGGQHIGCLKTRGAGFSWMEACDGVYNYNFIPGSKSYYFAGTEPFLIGDAIMDKVQTGLDFINDNSPYWKQNRKVKSTLMHQKASYLDEMGVERGKMSEIIAQIVDKPSKTRGKRGRKVTFEEGGSFPHLEPALEVCLGSLREGTVYVGQASVFGTGGEVGPSIQGLENIFSYPEAWDMLAFPNVWKDGYQHTKCGYFVPCYRANSFYMDGDGNVDMPAAIQADNVERVKKKKSGKPKDLDRRKAEYPRNPDEALSRMTGNGFNIAEIDSQINRLTGSKELAGMIRYGDVIHDPSGYNGVAFQVKPKHLALPIEEYPHVQSGENATNLKGCVSVIERPFTDHKGRVPDGMYLITFDPYYKEQSDDLTSLWSCKVWKLDNQHSTSFMGLPVAWYAGRPTRYEDNHDIMFKLAQMYNATIQGEIAGGGQSVVTYARLHHMMHMLCKEPEIAIAKDHKGKKEEGTFLMNMATERKQTGIVYLEDWHVQKRGVDSKGNIILNVHRIYDIAWLWEMRKFDPSKLKGNYDRISDALVAMYMLKQNYIEQRKSNRKKPKDFFDRVLYGEAAGSYDSGVTAAY